MVLISVFLVTVRPFFFFSFVFEHKVYYLFPDYWISRESLFVLCSLFNRFLYLSLSDFLQVGMSIMFFLRLILMFTLWSKEDNPTVLTCKTTE